MGGLARGELDRLVRIERPLTDTGFRGAGKGGWQPVQADVWVSIREVLPSRAERMAEGFNIATRPSRVRMAWRDDITPAMRLVDTTTGEDGRIMQIIAGPAEIGNRDGIELMVEDYSSAGNAA